MTKLLRNMWQKENKQGRDLRDKKVVLLTGGTGSLGKALINSLEANKIIVFSRDEFKQHEMAKTAPDNVRFFIGNVRDKERLCQAMGDVDIVIHAAALKQVPILEYNPTEAVKTNIYGTQNVIEACLESGVKRAVFISTDKAVNPINLYGATKLAGEKLWIAANAYNKTIFSAVRYGNVIGSRGSVVPLFKKLKEEGASEFPITDHRMTRFWLTLDDAVGLVKTAIEGEGKIYVPWAESAKIFDIAQTIASGMNFVPHYPEIGVRPGEKIHEKLVSEDMKDVMMVDLNGGRPIAATEEYDSETAPRMSLLRFRQKAEI